MKPAPFGYAKARSVDDAVALLARYADARLIAGGQSLVATLNMRLSAPRLLIDINAVVAEIREAPASTVEDYLALLDVALEHEIDLAADIAFYGPEDYPMIARLLRAIAEEVRFAEKQTIVLEGDEPR